MKRLNGSEKKSLVLFVVKIGLIGNDWEANFIFLQILTESSF